MAKLNYWLDTRSGSGDFPLKLRISHLKKTAYISMDIRLAEDQWDGKEVVNHKNQKSLNEYLKARMTLAEANLLNFKLKTSLDKLSVNEIKVLIESDGQTTEDAGGNNFLRFYEKRMAEAKRNNTRLSYDSAINRMKLYDPLLSIRTFEDIDENYIKKMTTEIIKHTAGKTRQPTSYLKSVGSAHMCLNRKNIAKLTRCITYHHRSAHKKTK